ncbi:MAG: hypothetical protein WKG07_31465 [Hymenobacter sp.]
MLAMSYTFPKWPYPYSHETVFDGLDQMEYPMMVNDNPSATREESHHPHRPRDISTRCSRSTWAPTRRNTAGWTRAGPPSASGLSRRLIQPGLVDDYGMRCLRPRRRHRERPAHRDPDHPANRRSRSSSTPTPSRAWATSTCSDYAGRGAIYQGVAQLHPHSGTASTRCPTTSFTP